MKKFSRKTVILVLLGLFIVSSVASFIYVSRAGKNKDIPGEALKKPGDPNYQLIKLGAVRGSKDSCVPARLQFVDEKHGWLTCSDQFWATNDGGKEWESLRGNISALRPQQNRKIPGDLLRRLENSIFDYDFIDPETGWGVFGDGVYRTKDGGKSWTQVEIIAPLQVGVISSIRFRRDGKEGWAVGGICFPISLKQRQTMTMRNSNSDGTQALAAAVFHTVDGGLTWRRQYLSSAIDSTMTGIFISSRDQVWAYGTNGLFFLEGNGWKQVDYRKGACAKETLLETTGLSEKHYDVYDETALFLLDSHEGWLSFANGFVAKTTDGGKTWCDLLSPEALRSSPADVTTLTKMYFSDPQNGLGLGSDGSLYHTVNGGAAWEMLDLGVKFGDVYFSEGGAVWALGGGDLFLVSHR